MARLSPQRQQLQDLRKLLRAARGFLSCLTVPERDTLRNKIGAFVAARAKQGVDLSKADVDADFLAQVDTWIGEVGTAFKAKREVKPRNEARDKEIVRLREVEKTTWGELPRALLQKNAKWCKPNGKPLESETSSSSNLAFPVVFGIIVRELLKEGRLGCQPNSPSRGLSLVET